MSTCFKVQFMLKQATNFITPMITIHKRKNEETLSKLELELKNLVIAYQEIEHDSSDIPLPYIEEDGKKFITEEEVESWLSGLKKELDWQRSMSGDGCYIPPDSDDNC